MRVNIEEIRTRGTAERGAGDFDAHEILHAIARPRLTGSAQARAVKADVRARFESLSYGVRELPFTLSTWPARYALSIAGSIYLASVLISGIVLLAGGAAAALVALGVGALLIAAVGIAAPRAVDRFRFGRTNALNLLFQREPGRPRYLLMAHIDSKSQLIPLSLRGPALIFAFLAWAALVLLGVMALARPQDGAVTFGVALLAVIAGTLLALSWVDNQSPGALDNASGVAALLAVAAREAERGDVAFLITDAEELGLAGARAAAPLLPAVHGVINVDGLDDDGAFYVLERFGWPRRGLAPHLAVALMGAAVALDRPCIRRDVPFGMLLDHMALVRAGMPSLTLMRGTLASLHRVHRVIDDVEHLSGAGVRDGADLLCHALRVLRNEERVAP